MISLILKRQFLVIIFSFISFGLTSQTFVEQTGIALTGLANGTVEWGDYDNDGDLDILLSGSDSSFDRYTKIYRNNGNNSFSEQTGISLPGLSSDCSTWGDYDNDGDLDILLAGSSSSVVLPKIYRNNGNNSFSEQSEILLTGLFLGSAAWGDYNNDGNLDILMTGQNEAGHVISRIYRNNGNNNFSEQKDIVLAGVKESSVTWGDSDNDGDLDIFLSGVNSEWQSIFKIYRNNGHNSFTEYEDQGIVFKSVDLGDYNSDGYLDIIGTSQNGWDPFVSGIYKNIGGISFTAQSGFFSERILRGFAEWGDYDNDGDSDLIIAGDYLVQPYTYQSSTKIYRNNGDNTFTELIDTALPGVRSGCAAWGDYDNDGDLDFLMTGDNGSEYIAKVYKNETIISNTKPEIPTNLHSTVNDGKVTFSWDKATDTETPQEGISYNLYVYKEGDVAYASPPNAFNQSDINNGGRLVAKPGHIQWSATGYTMTDLSPDVSYNWSIQAVDAGFLGSEFSPEQSFIIPLYSPKNQANNIGISDVQENQASVSWTNGGGTKRVVFIKAALSGTADPVDNTTYKVNDLTPEGWKCVYNGSGNSIVITGLSVNTDYQLQVSEYNGAAGSEKYARDAAYQNPTTFNTRFTWQSGINLQGISEGHVAWGDYDNDGDLDIFLTGNSVSKIYKNNGNNSFSEETSILLSGVSQSSAEWGDYDNDNDLDLIITGSSISKIYRNNGNNQFSEEVSIPLTGVSESSVDWGDYDNDGDLDILLTGATGNSLGYSPVSKIYRNNNGNSFTEQPGIDLTGVYYSSCAWGDYDGDNDLDILLTGARGDYRNYYPVSKIYRNDGNNLFSEQTDIKLTGIYNGSVDWGDYDNDGDFDILLSGDSGSGYVSKIYNNSGKNSFSDVAGINLPGVAKSSLRWGDYDNDGDLDILLTGDNDSSYVSKIFRNDLDNTFTELSGTSFIGVGKSSTAWGDYDNDGDLDILLSGETISGSVTTIYRNEILTPNAKPLIPDGLHSEWQENSLIFSWNKSSDSTTPTNTLNYNLRIGTTPGGSEVRSGSALPGGDLLLPDPGNLISDTSIVLKLPFNKYYWSVQAIDIGRMPSDFSLEEVTPTDTIQAKDLQAFIKNKNSLLVRWENGNGLRRVVFGRFSSTTGTAEPQDGIFYHSEPYFGKGDRIDNTEWYCLYDGFADSVIIYGINERLSYDIQVIEYFEKNDLPVYFNTRGNANPGVFSSSLFSEQIGIGLPDLNYQSSNWGDYNNDGYLDLLFTGGSISRLYRNNGDNHFSALSEFSLPSTHYANTAWGDSDGDGDLDIIFTASTYSGFDSKLYTNNDNDSFTEQSGISFTESHAGDLAWGDYDNDGDLDILLTGRTSGTIQNPNSKVYRNNGENSFSEQSSIALIGVRSSSVAWGDYDNDGDLDIIMSGYTDNPVMNRMSEIYRNNGNNSFSEELGIVLPPVSGGSQAWGDYDNDGDLDFLFTGGGNSRIYRNNGDSGFSEQSRITIEAISESSVAWGDFDNDGDLDILLNGRDSLGFFIAKVYRNDNSDFSEETGIELKGAPDGEVDWGDYDNDGDLDMVIGQKVYRNNTFMRAGAYSSNVKPAAPDNLLSEIKPDGLKLSWSPVKSDETNYRAMSYNVRVGTVKGSANICPPHANFTDGYRTIVSMGNAQLDTTFFLKNLPYGKYYWSVQAVDQGYKGGDWSAIDSVTLKTAQTFFTSDTVCQGLPTSFTDQSLAPDGIISWLWDFDDGEYSSLQHPQHVYNSAGLYRVKLTIVSNSHIKDSLVHNVIVKAKPSANFIADPVCHGNLTAFTNTTLNNKLNIISWLWDFGDGTNYSTLKEPNNHGYVNAGSFNARLTVLADDGCSDSVEKVVQVIPKPEKFITSEGNPCEDSDLTLKTTENPSYSYQWKYDGQHITGANQSYYHPDKEGEYSVIISSQCGEVEANYNVGFAIGPPKPDIYVRGPEVWYLACSNDSASDYQWFRDGIQIYGANEPIYIAKDQLGDYQVKISSENKCYAFSDIVTIPNDLTGVEEDPFAGLKIYPNPTPGLCTIEIDNSVMGELIIDIFKESGAKIINVKFHKETSYFRTEIDMSAQPAGVYLINLLLQDYRASRSLILE